MTIRTKALGLTALAVAAALALTACSETGGKDAAESAAAAAAGTGAQAAGGGAVADTPRFTIAMVTHEAPGDSFWDKVRAGAQVAAAKDNIDLKYSNDPTGPGEATLIQNAVDSKVNGIAATLLSPDTLKGSMAAATAANIPVVAFNTGISTRSSAH
jgi:simple sugar transport system substrate-binding protein